MRSTLTARSPRTFRYRFGVLPGRFQIVTLDHLRNALALSEICERGVVVVGSANQSRDTRNPFTAEERIAMWKDALPEDIRHRFDFVAQEDVGNRVEWASQVERKVGDVVRSHGCDPDDTDIAIFGHRKDPTSFYLDDFKLWPLEEMPDLTGNSASDVRRDYFQVTAERTDPWLADLVDRVPSAVIGHLRDFMRTGEYARLREESSRADSALRPYAVRSHRDGPGLPHPVTIVTVDAVVVQGNRLLLQRRRQYPGKGLWGLVGGVLHQELGAVESAIAHLVEKSGIDLTAGQLRRSVVDTWFHDDPNRSTYGRRITFPTLIHLQPTVSGRTPEERRRSIALPRVRASDDTRWVTFEEARGMRDQLIEDHPIIIDRALVRLGIRNPY